MACSGGCPGHWTLCIRHRGRQQPPQDLLLLQRETETACKLMFYSRLPFRFSRRTAALAIGMTTLVVQEGVEHKYLQILEEGYVRSSSLHVGDTGKEWREMACRKYMLGA